MCWEGQRLVLVRPCTGRETVAVFNCLWPLVRPGNAWVRNVIILSNIYSSIDNSNAQMRYLGIIDQSARYLVFMRPFIIVDKSCSEYTIGFKIRSCRRWQKQLSLSSADMECINVIEEQFKTTVWIFKNENNISQRKKDHDDVSVCIIFSSSLNMELAIKALKHFMHGIEYRLKIESSRILALNHILDTFRI